MTDRIALLTAAVRWHQGGASVLPVKTDGSKAPGGGNWKGNQTERAPMSQIAAWFDIGSDETDGLGLVTGEASGFLEMLEAEGPAIADGYLDRVGELCADNGLGDVWATLCGGYTEKSGGNGLHILFRTEGPARKNTKLACRPHPTDMLPSGRPKTQVLLETRGEGGYVVVAPSAGRTRSDGGQWLANGSSAPDTVPVITCEQRDQLYAVITMLDEMPAREQAPDRTPSPSGVTAGLRPGDDFNEKADWNDDCLLGGAGWRRVHRVGPGWGWQRPGKDTPGLSATTGQSGSGALDRLYVFSSSTDLPTEEPLSKFWVYAELHHGGDLGAAARALVALGYGEPATVTMSGEIRFDDPFGGGTRVQTEPVTSTTAPDALPDDFGPPVPPEGQIPLAPRQFTADTQDAHAIMLIARHGASIRYCPEMRKWLRWENHLWRPQADDGGAVYEHAKEVARSLPSASKDETRYKRACLTANGITAALRMAQTDRVVRIGVDDLDSHPWELNTPHGIVDLRTGALGPSAPSHLHTKSTLVAPDFDADRAAWLAFLAVTFGSDTEVIDWVQRLLGMACVGEVREHIFPVLFGQGANGKSVLLETVAGLLGDYAIALPPKFLTQNGQGVTDAAGLIGVRLAIASETNEGEAFDEALVKRLTGGDTVRARFMRQDWFQFTPSHTLLLATNHRLEVPSGGGRSFWRRVREVPFNHIVPDDEQDPELAQKMIAEHGPAILAWLAEGAARYARSGLSDPASVRAATASYAESADQIGQFTDELCSVYAGARENLADVYGVYLRWCETSHIKPKEVKGRRQFTEALARLGVDSRKGNKGRYFLAGLRLLSDEERNGADGRNSTRDDDPFG